MTMQPAEEDYDNSVFKLKSYWDERFQKEEQYDWLVKYDELEQYLSAHLTDRNARILVLGCGNSTFSSDLYDHGYKNITNIDFSEVCIERMQLKHSNSRPDMSWVTMDMTELTFDDESFDIVIDKASMDAILVDEGDVWDPEPETIALVDKMNLGISRVLKKGGKFIQITFAQPHFRTKYLMAQRVLQFECSPFESLKGYCKRYSWNMSHVSVNPKIGCISYYMYYMVKEAEAES